MFRLFKIILIILLIVNVNQDALAQQKHSVVAVVNNEVITDLDVKKRAQLIIASTGLSNDSKTFLLVKDQVLQMLIDEKLIAAEAKSLSLEADDMDMNFAMNSIAEKNNISMNELDKYLKRINVAKDELERQIRHQLLWNKIIQSAIKPRITVSDKEVEENLNAVAKALENSREEIEQIKIAEIVLYSRKNKNQANLQALTEKLYEEINKGVSFAKLARDFSQSATASSGGEIGWVYFSQLSPQFADGVKNVSNGEVSRPILLNDGIHIIKVLDKKVKVRSDIPEKINEEQIKDWLFSRKTDLQVKSYLRKLRRNGFINIK
jgi:peptidyl-prolyl cis-trans isomerase SurA